VSSVTSSLQARAGLHKSVGSGFDSWLGPQKFSCALFILSTFSSPTVHTASNVNEYKGLPWGKEQPVGASENCAVQVVPNVYVKLEDQLAISPPPSESSSLHRKALPLTIFYSGCIGEQHKYVMMLLGYYVKY
jgi:hypothetical protein